MWKENAETVNKMFKGVIKETGISHLLRFSASYPQTNKIPKNKIRLNGSSARALHISTALIVVINLYI
jgi:hypothetical protein